jgi:uncharacterized protein YdeI (YjbR/CyaY-like superfamily)
MTCTRGDDPVFFPTPAAFRRWLARHHADRTELRVGFHKVGSGRPSMTWEQSVDEALCFGWIDGVRRRIDDQSYEIRFTPRRRGSMWSVKNVKSVERLIEEGRMMPAGDAAFTARTAKRTGRYSFEREDQAPLAEPLKKRFRKEKDAWRFFTSQPPGYQRIMRHWIRSAAREATRLKRLDRLIEVSAREERVNLVAPFRDPR